MMKWWFNNKNEINDDMKTDVENFESVNSNAEVSKEKDTDFNNPLKKISLSDVFDHFIITFSDFNQVLKIPCLKESMIIGVQAMLIFGIVTYSFERNLIKAFKKSFFGFIIGNLFGWQQCNSVRYKSLNKLHELQKKMLEKKSNEKKN